MKKKKKSTVEENLLADIYLCFLINYKSKRDETSLKPVLKKHYFLKQIESTFVCVFL